MTQTSLLNTSEQQDILGRDEMNLAEFPITRLGPRDKREVLTYKKGDMHWEVRAASGLGLPDEFGDRVIATLLKLSAEQNFVDRRVYFSTREILQNLGLTDSGGNYKSLGGVLQQLAGMTVYSKNSFWDNKRKKRVVVEGGFNVIDRYQLKKQGTRASDEDVLSEGYVVWGEQFWDSMKSGYIKKLNYSFYLGLQGSTTRRLYRLLDKWLYNSGSCEVDVFDLASRIGMQDYLYPSKVLEKLSPGLDELVSRQFLNKYEILKKGRFTRVKIYKHSTQSTDKGRKDYRVWDSHNQVYRDPDTWEEVE